MRTGKTDEQYQDFAAGRTLAARIRCTYVEFFAKRACEKKEYRPKTKHGGISGDEVETVDYEMVKIYTLQKTSLVDMLTNNEAGSYEKLLQKDLQEAALIEEIEASNTGSATFAELVEKAMQTIIGTCVADGIDSDDLVAIQLTPEVSDFVCRQMHKNQAYLNDDIVYIKPYACYWRDITPAEAATTKSSEAKSKFNFAKLLAIAATIYGTVKS